MSLPASWAPRRGQAPLRAPGQALVAREERGVSDAAASGKIAACSSGCISNAHESADAKNPAPEPMACDRTRLCRIAPEAEPAGGGSIRPLGAADPTGKLRSSAKRVRIKSGCDQRGRPSDDSTGRDHSLERFENGSNDRPAFSAGRILGASWLMAVDRPEKSFAPATKSGRSKFRVRSLVALRGC